MSPKLKHQGGSAPCVLCGSVTSCEWPNGDDRWIACPPCARELIDQPELRAALPPRASQPWEAAQYLADLRRDAEDFEAKVEELAAELAEAFPDPVDVFEDDLARELGLRRHPAMPLDQWRPRRRVSAGEPR